MIEVGGLSAIAQEHGTPVYVYDLDEIGDRVSALRAAVPDRVELAYAVKANPSLAVLALMAGAGIGADVASGGELAAARRAGFDPATIVFTGPGKRDPELATAASLPLRAVTVESLGELERLRGIAVRVESRVRVLLRVAGEERPGNVIGSGQGRFGMRWTDLVKAARKAASAPELDLVGVHRFDASNLCDAEALLDRARGTVAAASRLAREVNVPFTLVDLGGGLGIPYRDEQQPLDLDRLGRGLRQLVREVDVDPRMAGARLLLEPGRWLVGPAGTYVTRVVDVKESEVGRIVTVDGGIHHLLRPALVGEPHRIRSLAPDGGSRGMQRVVVGGPLCTALDVLGRVELPSPAVGDLIAVLDAGAYGFTESMPLFLSHPTPAEVVMRDGRIELARPRTEPEALLDPQLMATLTPPVVAT